MFLTASNALAVLGITLIRPPNRVFIMPWKSKKFMKVHDIDEIPCYLWNSMMKMLDFNEILWWKSLIFMTLHDEIP